MDALVGIVAAAGCLASAEDLWRRRISPWIPAATVAAACGVHAVRSGWTGLGLSLAGSAAGLVVFLLFHLLGGLGGGDVKLMAAFGAALGPQGVLVAAVLGALLGALHAGAALLVRRGARTIPYAPSLSLGALAAVLGRGSWS